MKFISSASLAPLASKTVAGLLAGAMLLAASADASAYYRRFGGPGYGFRGHGFYNGGGYRRYGYYNGGYRHRGFVGAPLIAGAVGALALGALAASAYGYPRYGYGPGYADGGDCYIQSRRYWDGYGYVVRRVRVCD